VLATAGAPTDLVVVGNRGRRGFAGLALGSVSHDVALHAPGPVVVVRARDDSPAGPVVVGGDTAHNDNALRAGFEQAANQHSELIVAHAYAPPVRLPDVPSAAYLGDEEQQRQNILAELTEAAQPWREKYPDVPVDLVAVMGHPTEVLVGASRTAQLVVVGHRSGPITDHRTRWPAL
jgi:nucleotide-binding universal stress UspA family protein